MLLGLVQKQPHLACIVRWYYLKVIKSMALGDGGGVTRTNTATKYSMALGDGGGVTRTNTATKYSMVRTKGTAETRSG